jgi:KDO2-lipid IV(A) lauroyltransferase
MSVVDQKAAADRTCGIPFVPLGHFLAPRWWPVWLGAGLMRLLGALPLCWRTPIASTLGALAWLVARRDRHITLTNVRLCFPELSERGQEALGRRHFASLVMSLFETANVWWDREARYLQRVELEGLDHLATALAKGKGVLLVSAHFTTNEMAAAALMSTPHEIDILYRRADNALLEQLALRGRSRPGNRLVPNDLLVEILRGLKRNAVVLYAPDQLYDGPGHVVAPFFGVPALANPGTTTIARATGAVVLPYFPLRLPDGCRYRMTIGAPVPYFPSSDPDADVHRYHRLIEDSVRRAPEQYLWSYKRFKPLAGQADPYRGGRIRGGRPES